MRESAGVILVRAPRQVYLVKRGGSLNFLPGFHSFPGGVLEEGESLVQCAARELLEETGLLVGAGPADPELRRAVFAREAAMPEVDPSCLWPAGVRITPPYIPRRFRTQFYMWECPYEPEIWPGELAEGRWWDAAEALEAWERGDIFLVAPTLATLHELVEHPFREAAEALEAMPHGTGVPGHPIPLGPGVRCLTQESSTLPPARVTLTALLGTERLLIVDPGSALPEELQRLRDSIDAPVQEVLLTHHHPDHVAGAPLLGYPVAAHEETAKRLDFPVDRLVGEGERWDLGVRVEALHTPGHAPGHLCLWLEERGILLAGDLTAGYGTILVDPSEGSMAQYCASLERVRRLQPRLVISAHGPPFGPGSDLPGRILEHRRQREERIFQSLPGTLEELLERAYSDAQHQDLARRSLLAHLIKLEEEGRASHEGDRWFTL